MQDAIKNLEEQGKQAKSAAHKLAHISSEIKNKALINIANGLLKSESEIIKANETDYKKAKTEGMSDALLDRLLLNSNRIHGMAEDVRTVVALPDPVGEVFDMKTLPNGILLGKKRVPIGVIASIYESRPNVTIDISSLCIKSGNAVILRGGKETINSNKALVKITTDACTEAGLPVGTVQYVGSTDRILVNHLLKMRNCIDLLVPRGGADLIRFVAENATIATVTGGIGICHAYVDKSADIGKAVAIVYNAKVQRPTVCNALDCVLIHKAIAKTCLPQIAIELSKAGVELHCDKLAMSILKPISGIKLVAAKMDDWGKEFLALIAAIKVVDSIDQALQHIETFGSGHSETIITDDYNTALRFLDEVDAAVVYVNASTRFTDGGQFGLGSEVGISTQKLHARGPMGLKELTTYKWIAMGSGQVRP